MKCPRSADTTSIGQLCHRIIACEGNRARQVLGRVLCQAWKDSRTSAWLTDQREGTYWYERFGVERRFHLVVG